MNESIKAWVNLVINLLGAGGLACLGVIAADSTLAAFKKPFVLITIGLALLPVLRAQFSETPASGKILDVKIETAAAEKSAVQIQSLLDTGVIRTPESMPRNDR